LRYNREHCGLQRVRAACALFGPPVAWKAWRDVFVAADARGVG